VGKIKIDCASCETVVRVDEDKITARTLCPKCGGILQAVEEPAEAVEEDEAPAPRPSRQQKSATRKKTGSVRPRARQAEEEEEEEPEKDAVQERPAPARENLEIAAWKKVRIGLLVLLSVTGASLVSTIVGQFLGMFAWQWGLTILGKGWVVWLVYALCSLVVTLAAYVLLGFTPRRYAPRSLIFAVIGLDLFTNAFFVLAMVMAWRGLAGMGEGGLEGAVSAMKAVRRLLLLMIPVQLLGALQLILLPLFLRRVAHAMEDTQSEHHCDTIMKWTGISLLLRVAWPLMMLMPLAVLGMLASLLGLVGGILSVATQGIYMHLHLCLRESIAKHMRRLRRQRKKRKEGEMSTETS
jgi:hypothetical protein